MSEKEAIWRPSYQFVCNSCHLAWGALLTDTLAHFGLGYWAALSVMLLIIPKELWLDVWMERNTYTSELIDICFYGLGCGVGSLLFFFGG